MSKYQILLKIWARVHKRRKIQFLFTILFINIVSILEIISIGAVIPFLTILVNPQKLFDNELISQFLPFLKTTNIDELTIIFTVIFCLAALIAGMMKLVLLLIQTKLSLGLGVDFSIELFENTLNQPYKVHISRNSSEIHAGIRKVESLISYIFSPALTFIGSIFISFSIIFMLVNLNSSIAILTLAIFGVIYGLIIKFTKNKIQNNSKVIASKIIDVTKSISEGIGAIRNVILDKTQAAFINNFKNAIIPMRHASAWNLVTSQSPRYIVESLGIIALSLIALAFTSSEDGIINLIPTLGAFVLGIQKLMPIVQQTYGAFIDAKTGWESVKDIVYLMEKHDLKDKNFKNKSPIKFFKKIELKNVSFNYSKNSDLVLKNLNLSIKKGECIGLIGETGIGKSTLIDIIMGLLKPTKGTLEIDGIPINNEEKTLRWQKHISHVPQSIFLTDTSFKENIALGTPLHQIDSDRIIEVSKWAKIHETIMSKQDKYYTFVGERGVKLSGGQRQRIGIARALYKQASVLILDEATSSVDNKTESLIVESLRQHTRNLTVIIISHELTSLKYCDRIIELSKGKLIEKNYNFK